ncbi:hypothetical protein [Amycolatopsis saalfeldensis]|uniref:Uncharacterized protein n=1 Tax=Amycolatopsis saalfeldensis TaxID=394193 RepID=A0A1H8YT57_9PSEU|nr:hypothetical protein [Amycolatopsis saalfeldensis]SEP54558.1 hypothetical protein SAMN04489732_1563 [Amycolatopsis saalfeldensis]
MSKTFPCQASRHGEWWVANIPQHAVYGYGRTLKALHDNITQGLSLVDVTAEVTITPTSPELDRLRRTEAAYEAALVDAATTLAAGGSTVRDIADATRVPIARIKALQATCGPEPEA